MSKYFGTSINLGKSELQNAVIQNLSAAPGSPGLGQVYYDTTVLQTLQWNGAAWVWKATDSAALNGQLPAYYLARANHTGTQLAATISDLAGAVQAYRLDQFAAPTNAVNFNGQRLTNVGTPQTSTDGVNMAYVQSLVQGQDPKPTAQVATAAALPASTYSNGTAGVGATLTATANGALVVDGYTVALNDRVLVKNQASNFQNGLYGVTATGGAGAPFVLTRDPQMDQSNEFGGALIAVENNGSTTGNTLWLATVAESITVGTTGVPLTQLNSSTALAGSTSIQISGNAASVIVAAGGGVTIGGSGVQLDTAVAVRKYAVAFGDGSATSYTITHNLGTQDATVAVYRATTPFDEVECDVQHTSANTLTLAFSAAPTTGQYRVVVHG